MVELAEREAVVHQRFAGRIGIGDDMCCIQEPILHLEADLHTIVKWADTEEKRWAFTVSNAGAAYFEDRCDLEQLEEVNWQAIKHRLGRSIAATHPRPSLRRMSEKSKRVASGSRCSLFSMSLISRSTARRPSSLWAAALGVSPFRAGSGWSIQSA